LNLARKLIPDSGYRSRFSHHHEEASPGYYKVLLQDYKILAELTATKRAGMHRYTFPETAEGHVIIDITREKSRPELHKDAFIEVAGNNQIQGYTTVISTSTGEPMTWYFFAEFSRPFDTFGTFSNSNAVEKQRRGRRNIRCRRICQLFHP
jgi:putative alpha-1,2-mannosidase